LAYSVEILPSAAADLAALPLPIRRRLSRRIDALARNPRPPGAKLLHGGERLYRIRAGDYRILYRVEDRRLIVLVVKLGHRREIYRRLRT
jgi:mRNA interferase RelE/StbE